MMQHATRPKPAESPSTLTATATATAAPATAGLLVAVALVALVSALASVAAILLGVLGLTRLPEAAAAVSAAGPVASLGTLRQERPEPVVLAELVALSGRCGPGERVRLSWREPHGPFLVAREVDYDPAAGRLTQRVGGGEDFTFPPVTPEGIRRALAARGGATSFCAAMAFTRHCDGDGRPDAAPLAL